MNPKTIKKAISVITLITFLFTNTAYGAPSRRSFFKNKKVDYKKLSTQSEKRLQKKKAIFQDQDERAEKHKKQAQRVLSSHLSDLSQIHIPSELGRVIEVYDASSSENRTPKTEHRLIVHIQDLHTNPEAQYNEASILALLIKDYGLNLVCSEGADGVVDTSSVSSFPDYEVRKKTAQLFVNSGELTAEEYLSITKYPDLPIWGIEDRDIYFQNIIEFNKIMKFSPSSQVFISQAKKALTQFKDRVYTRELKNLDQKETDYENKKIETDEYLKSLTSYIQKFNIPITKYRNITLLNETMQKESQIDHAKVIQESQNLMLNLQAQFSRFSKSASQEEMDALKVQSQLFREQKISPFSFYSYLKDLALKHHVIASPPSSSVIARRHEVPTKQSQYPHLLAFIDYLTKVNSLDSTKLFNEMEDLSFEVKQSIAKTQAQKDLITALRNIKFLEGFFNLKVSNEELDYYLANKDRFTVSWFKSVITNLTSKTNLTSQTNYIDYNPALIDDHLQELEDFYKTVKARDVAMVNNAVSEIEKRNAKVSTLIAGGFHTKGITRMLRDQGYSYIVVSPYSSTEIDEENYHRLLTGKREPIIELLSSSKHTLRVLLGFMSEESRIAYNETVPDKLVQINGGNRDDYKIHGFDRRSRATLVGVALDIHRNKTPEQIKSRFAGWPLSPLFVAQEGEELQVRLNTQEGAAQGLMLRYTEQGDAKYMLIDSGGDMSSITAEQFKQAKYAIFDSTTKLAKAAEPATKTPFPKSLAHLMKALEDNLLPQVLSQSSLTLKEALVSQEDEILVKIQDLLLPVSLDEGWEGKSIDLIAFYTDKYGAIAVEIIPHGQEKKYYIVFNADSVVETSRDKFMELDSNSPVSVGVLAVSTKVDSRDDSTKGSLLAFLYDAADSDFYGDRPMTRRLLLQSRLKEPAAENIPYLRGTIDREIRDVKELGIIKSTKNGYVFLIKLTREQIEALPEDVREDLNKWSKWSLDEGLSPKRITEIKQAIAQVSAEAGMKVDRSMEGAVAEGRFASLLQSAINGDKVAYRTIKDKPSEEVIAYFEERVPEIIRDFPESPFGYGNGYDMRGKAWKVEGEEVTMTPENMYLTGKLLGTVQYARNDDERDNLRPKRVLITGDLRHHTPILRYTMALGFASVGVDVEFSEEIFDSGAHNVYSAENPDNRYDIIVQVAGSHNPLPDNGAKIKAYLGKEYLEPVYEDRLELLYRNRGIAQTLGIAKKLGAIEEITGLIDKVVDFYDQTLPTMEKDQVLVADARAGCGGAIAQKLFEKRGFTVVDMDKFSVPAKGDGGTAAVLCRERVKGLWKDGNRKILVLLNGHPDPDMGRGIWDPSKPEALVETSNLVNVLNADLLGGMPRVFGGVWDGDADRFTMIIENGQEIPAFEMTLPFYQRFLLDEQNKDVIIEMVRAGGDPLWLGCDVRSNDKLDQMIKRINTSFKKESGIDRDFLKSVFINTGYPPALDFIAWRIQEMDEFVAQHQRELLEKDSDFMDKYAHLKLTYFIAEASGHNFFHAAPSNPNRPCDSGVAAFVSLVNIREGIDRIEASYYGIQLAEDEKGYELVHLFKHFPVVYTSGEIRIPVANDIKISLAHKLGAVLAEKYGAELLPIPEGYGAYADEKAITIEGFEGLRYWPTEAGDTRVAGYKFQFKDGRSILLRWSNTSARWTNLFTGLRADERETEPTEPAKWTSLIDLIEEVTALVRAENLDVTDLEKEIARLREVKRDVATPTTLTPDELAEGILNRSKAIWQHVKVDGKSAADDIVQWFGWVDAPDRFLRRQWRVRRLKEELREEGITKPNVVDLGTGGSGLGIRTYAEIFGADNLRVVDLQDPQEHENVKKWIEERGWDGTMAVTLNGVVQIIDMDTHELIAAYNPEDPQEVEKAKTLIKQRGWRRTIFVVASKSWGTTESRNQERVFRYELAKVIAEGQGLEDAEGVAEKVAQYFVLAAEGRMKIKLQPEAKEVAREVAQQFVGVTDAGKMKIGETQGFRRLRFGTDNYAVFINNRPSDAEKGLQIGGRYSSDSYFSMVPAELAGLPHEQLLKGARDEYNQFEQQLGKYIGVQIGEVLNDFRLKGRDKITFILPEELKPFGPWVQQLINESLNKEEGTTAICITGEEVSNDNSVYGDDRVFIRIEFGQGDGLEIITELGIPEISLKVRGREDINRLQYRFKVATAVLGNRMGIHPFNQPFVEDSKKITKALLDPNLSRAELTAKLNEAAARNLKREQGGVKVYYTGRTEEAIGIDAETSSIQDIIAAFLETINEGDYLYASPYTYGSPKLQEAFSEIRTTVRDNHPVHPATLFGIGSRCQHSDNQMNNATDKAVVVVFTFDTPEGIDMVVPGRNYTLAQENMAHALGRIGALEKKGKRVIRIHLSEEYRKNPDRIKELFIGALEYNALKVWSEEMLGSEKRKEKFFEEIDRHPIEKAGDVRQRVQYWIKRLKEARTEGEQAEAMNMLIEIGEPAIPALTTLARNNAREPVGKVALGVLKDIGRNAPKSGGTDIENLKDLIESAAEGNQGERERLYSYTSDRAIPHLISSQLYTLAEEFIKEKKWKPALLAVTRLEAINTLTEAKQVAEELLSKILKHFHAFLAYEILRTEQTKIDFSTLLDSEDFRNEQIVIIAEDRDQIAKVRSAVEGIEAGIRDGRITVLIAGEGALEGYDIKGLRYSLAFHEDNFGKLDILFGVSLDNLFKGNEIDRALTKAIYFGV